MSSTVGGAIGLLIGAIGGQKLVQYISEMELNGSEQQSFESFVQIEEKNFSNDHNMIIFTLMPALLYNDLMLKCFVETFITSSPFANSKLFKFYFNENNLSKLKLEEEKVNSIAYDLLISNYEESRVKLNLIYGYIVGYDLDLSDYEPSNLMIKLLVEIWTRINVDDNIKSRVKLSIPFFSFGNNWRFYIL